MHASLSPATADAPTMPAPLPPLEGAEAALYEALRQVRRQLAGERGVPVFHILGNRSLRDLTVRRPVTTDGLLQVHGLGPAKVAAFGILLLIRLREEVARLGLPPGRVEVQPVTAAPVEPRGPAQRPVAFAAFGHGKSVAEVMVVTGRAQATVEGYLADYVEKMRPADLLPWVPRELQVRAQRALAGDMGGPLKPVFDAHGGAISYLALRLVRAQVQAAARAEAAASTGGGGEG